MRSGRRLSLVPVLLLGCMGLASRAFAAEYWILRDPASGPADFGARELAQALREKAHAVILKPLSAAGQPGGDHRIYLGRADSAFKALVAASGLSLPALPPQAFALRVAGDTAPAWFAAGGDEAGVMYGALEIAERIRLQGPAAVIDAEQRPYLRRRGVKFNWPLDARTPSYSDPSDAGAMGVATVWDMEFWKTQLDEMARNRMNCLSLWNLHPFPSLVKVPGYPDVALADVKTTFARTRKPYPNTGIDFVDADVLDNLVHVKTMTIEEKIAFWREVMRYARDRGIEVYLFTWNLFVYGAEGKHGITESQTNPVTTDYYRKCILATLRTYPDLAGFGITAGENLKGDKEGWLWSTYGLGVKDYVKENPSRSVRLIHREHQGTMAEIVSVWKDYPGPLDMSFKYSMAHAYSSPTPTFMKEFAADLPAGMKTFLTVRNDDFYYFRFGDPEYVRAYLKNVPKAKVEGFYYGPDGYILGRNITSKDSAWAQRSDMEKNWLAFRLWGRLGYDPEVPAETFRALVRQRLGGPASLYDAWTAASRIVPLVNRYHWDKSDFQWYPEGCLSHEDYKGYHDLEDFRKTGKMPGNDPGPAAQVADSLKLLARAALEGSRGWRRQTQAELRSTLGDIEALGHLGNYYAEKILGAAASGGATLQHMLRAAEHARLYGQSASAQYRGMWLNRMAARFDFGRFVGEAYGDLKRAGGSGLLPSARHRQGGSLLEAEDALLRGGAPASAISGHTGTGYAEFRPGPSQSIEWTASVPQAGTYVLEFRYALATGERPMALRANGRPAGSLSFGPTGSDGTWLLEAIEVDLAAGGNTLALDAEKDAPRIDHVNVILSGPTAVEAHPAPRAFSLALGAGMVRITLPTAVRLTLNLLDLEGRRVAGLHEGLMPPGCHGIPLRLDAIPAGRYFVEARAGGWRRRASLLHRR